MHAVLIQISLWSMTGQKPANRTHLYQQPGTGTIRSNFPGQRLCKLISMQVNVQLAITWAKSLAPCSLNPGGGGGTALPHTPSGRVHAVTAKHLHKLKA